MSIEKRNYKNDFEDVKNFALKYDFIYLANGYVDLDDRINQDKYIIFHDWTDGDELTFFITYNKIRDKLYPYQGCIIVDDLYHNYIISISLDEYDVTTNITDKLVEECKKHNIIS
jgi:hypothetical protein